MAGFLLKPRPVLGFFFLNKKKNPKPDPLGSGRAGYLRVGQKLPSLPKTHIEAS